MNWAKLLVSIVACQLAGALGALFTRPAIPGWYDGLQKPSFTPPGWLFGPAWITLYLLMGVAAYMVWQKGMGHPGVGTALAVFAVQLLLNALRSPLAGAIVIVILWLAILLTIFLFWRLSRPAALLLLPYILWVTYASALNISIHILNS
jgi:benzodiazapine receptor